MNLLPRLLLLLPIITKPWDAASKPCEVSYNSIQSELVADCSGRHLNDTPSYLPSNISILKLQNNIIVELTNNAFIKFPNLTHLDVSCNKLEVLSDHTFSGLTHLLHLNLCNNMLILDSTTFPKNIFLPLKNLQVLVLNENQVSSYDFPDGIFEPLTSLRDLRLDIWPAPGKCEGMKALQKLTHLEIIGYKHCDSAILRNNSFRVLENSPLEYLRLICSFTDIDSCVFCPLKNLSNLAVGSTFRSSLTLKKLAKASYPFVGRRMFEISLLGLQDFEMDIGSNSVVDLDTMSFLTDVWIERLILRQNRLTSIKAEILTNSTFCQCIEYLDLSSNNIKGDHGAVFKLPFLQQLRFVDVSYNRPNSLVNNKSLDITLAIFAPPKLEIVLLRHGAITVKFNGVHIYNTDNVRYIDVSNLDQFQPLGYVYGFKYVTELDISENRLDESFFRSGDRHHHLEILHCRKCAFTFNLMRSKHFFNMTSLRFLDLSETDLRLVESNTFSQFKHIENLSLSHNPLNYIPKEFTLMSSIKNLDMTFNSLTTLSHEEMRSLDDLTRRHDGFQLKLNGNTFTCNCLSLGFIVWLQETNVILDNHGNYTCLKNDGKVTNTLTFYREYLHHWRQCTGQTCFTYSLTSFFLLDLIIVVSFIIKKYFPVLEHYLLQRLGYKGPLPPERKDFIHDAYICYDSSDYQWPCHVLRKELQNLDKNIQLYLPDLHDLPGESKAEAIIEAISASWKVVVIISERSFTDEWFYFTIVTAVRLFSSHNAITSRIILLYKDDSPATKVKVPPMLLNVVSEINVMNINEDRDFWIRLHRSIIRDQGPEANF